MLATLACSSPTAPRHLLSDASLTVLNKPGWRILTSRGPRSPPRHLMRSLLPQPQEVRSLDRRQFLKAAGLTPLAVAGLPALGGAAWADDDDDDEAHGWRFVTVSPAATVAGVAHALIMNGSGWVGGGRARGGGTFVHANLAPTAPTPKPILFTGTWEARRLVSFNTIGSWGQLVAGIMVARVKLFPQGAPTVKATLEVVCNLAPAGILTGKPEGIFLTLDGSPPFGVFQPTVPTPTGLTIFTPPEAEDDDD